MDNTVDQAKNGSQKAFAKLYEDNYDIIQRLILSMTKNKDVTDDLVSVTFTKAFRTILNFKEDVPFKMWLKIIATNTCIDFIRRMAREKDDLYMEEEGVIEALSISDYSTPESEYIINEDMQSLEKSISELGFRAREILTLRYLKGYSYKSIANELGLSIGTVKSYISKATKQIKKTQKN